MRQPLRGGFILASMAMVWVVCAWSATAQEPKAKGKMKGKAKIGQKGSSQAERVSGVIIKVEESTQGQAKKEDSAPRGKRLTVNTSIPWSDWARDQATTKPESVTPKEAAAEGEKSVATKGQPRSVETLVTVDLPPDTQIDTRFRSPTDEATEGASTPEGVAEAEKDPADTSKKAKTKRAKGDGKELHFDLSNLKAGLFVDVEFQHETGTNLGKRVVVLRPVGGANIPAFEASPTPKSKD